MLLHNTFIHVLASDSMPAKRKQSTKEPESTLLPQRDYIEIALRFANHPKFQTVHEAQSIMWDVAGRDFDIAGPSGRDNYWNKWLCLINQEQDNLRRLLGNVLGDGDLPDDLEHTINVMMADKIRVIAQLESGHLRLHYEIAGVVSAAHLGVALLLHNDLESRLRKCGQCFRFFLAEGKRNRAKFCRGECADMNKAEKNAERQRVFNMRKWLEENEPKTLSRIDSLRKRKGDEAYKAELKSAYMKSKKRRK